MKTFRVNAKEHFEFGLDLRSFQNYVSLANLAAFENPTRLFTARWRLHYNT